MREVWGNSTPPLDLFDASRGVPFEAVVYPSLAAFSNEAAEAAASREVTLTVRRYTQTALADPDGTAGLGAVISSATDPLDTLVPWDQELAIAVQVTPAPNAKLFIGTGGGAPGACLTGSGTSQATFVTVGGAVRIRVTYTTAAAASIAGNVGFRVKILNMPSVDFMADRVIAFA
jgi:hypothetical protein